MGLGTSLCKGCGKKIVWARLNAETVIPLDTTAPCYTVREQNGQFVGQREMLSFVSHFSTCSHVNDFSKSKKGGPSNVLP